MLGVDWNTGAKIKKISTCPRLVKKLAATVGFLGQLSFNICTRRRKWREGIVTGIVGM